MKLINDDTNKDAIIAYLRDPEGDIEQLSEKQKKLLRWYVDAYSMLRNYTSVPDTIRVLVKFAQQAGAPISASTARRYVYDAQDVFGYSSKVKPEAIQHQAMEIINDAIAMARDQNDPKTMILGAKELVAIGGVEVEQPFNPEMTEQHIIEIGMGKSQQQILDYMAGKGAIDLDVMMGNAMNAMAEDVEYTEENGNQQSEPTA